MSMTEITPEMIRYAKKDHGVLVVGMDFEGFSCKYTILGTVKKRSPLGVYDRYYLMDLTEDLIPTRLEDWNRYKDEPHLLVDKDGATMIVLGYQLGAKRLEIPDTTQIFRIT